MIYAYLLFFSVKPIEHSLQEIGNCEPHYVNHLQAMLLRLGTPSCMTYYMPWKLFTVSYLNHQTLWKWSHPVVKTEIKAWHIWMHIKCGKLFHCFLFFLFCFLYSYGKNTISEFLSKSHTTLCCIILFMKICYLWNILIYRNQCSQICFHSYSKDAVCNGLSLRLWRHWALIHVHVKSIIIFDVFIAYPVVWQKGTLLIFILHITTWDT